MRRTIDRLQRLNDDNVIPNKLIKYKNKVGVTSFVCNMINNVDDKKFKKFDKPIDDDPRYVALISETADDRLQKFLWENYNHEIMSPIRFTIHRRVQILEVTMLLMTPTSYQSVSRVEDLSYIYIYIYFFFYIYFFL
uniref:Uncharacterized protein n=1 Tax=Schizaphis graminum TaxID=13262 RepID=A0A2S2N7W4_SCHGA